MGSATGLDESRELAVTGALPAVERRGSVRQSDLLGAYAEHLKTLVDLKDARPLTVAIDAGNGMGGHTVPAVFEGLPIPEVLTSGDHAKAAQWRRAEAERLTRERRPDLWAAHLRQKPMTDG